MRITMYYATFVTWKAISITTPIGFFGVKFATKGALAKYSLKWRKLKRKFGELLINNVRINVYSVFFV